MRLEFDLNLSQKQTLVMTPELIQAIQILQYNSQELETFVAEQLLSNPLLDRDPEEEKQTNLNSDEPEEEITEERTKEKVKGEDDFDWGEYLRERDLDDVSYSHFNAAKYSKEDDKNYYEQVSTIDISLSEHLMFQLQFAELSKGRVLIGKYIIESLDRNGYLTQDIDEIAEHLNVSPLKVGEVLAVIQSFDPSGVAAHDLQESLLIQLESTIDFPDIDKLKTSEVIRHYINDLAANKLAYIAKKISLPIPKVQEIADFIKTLEPKPGRPFGGEETKYILPDVILEKSNDGFQIVANESSIPRLIISPYYRQILNDEEKESAVATFLTERLNSATWLIKSIEQRTQTIYNVVEAIAKYQAEFLMHGEKHLKPLTLKKIADDIGMHESTVSRSINGKYVQTPRGVFELKYFFPSGVSDGSDSGVASRGVKALIKELIDNEDSSSPISDQHMSNAIKEKGIEVSRRTIAKYREEMGIKSSAGRRRY